MTDADGDLVQQYGYMPFGNERYQNNTEAFSVTNRYTGQQLDEETGLYFYGSRYYDPQLARFIQPDSVVPGGGSQSLNRYTYCNNNPLLFTDPTALGRANITVTGIDTNAIQHEGYGYFYAVDILPDAFLNPCDISISNLNPELGETISIGATVHTSSDNLGPMDSIPVTFHAQHGSGSRYKIGHTQYIDEIQPGDSNSVSVTWTNAAEDVYFIEAALEPDFSDKYSSNNSATQSLVVGDLPFDANFIVVEKRRIGRTLFDYDCKVELQNLSPLTVKVIQFEILSEPNNMIVIDRYVYDFPDITGNDGETSVDLCTLRVDRSEEINPAELIWKVTYEVVDTGQAAGQTSSTVVQFDEPASLGDITGEGDVDILDLAILAEDWLQSDSLADIYPPPPDGDDIVNFLDFAELAEYYMK